MGVQEVKAQADDVAGRFERIGGLTRHFHYAQKKGYSGVGMYARRKPSDVIVGLSARRVRCRRALCRARFDTSKRKFSVISCYFPSGSSGEQRQQAKYRFLDVIDPHLLRLKAEREFILVRRRQHRAQGDRPEELEGQPQELRLPARGARLDDAPARGSRPGRRVPRARTRGPSSTPGGATAARRAPRTWDGASTTTSPRRASRRRRGASRST